MLGPQRLDCGQWDACAVVVSRGVVEHCQQEELDEQVGIHWQFPLPTQRPLLEVDQCRQVLPAHDLAGGRHLCPEEWLERGVEPAVGQVGIRHKDMGRELQLGVQHLQQKPRRRSASSPHTWPCGPQTLSQTTY